MLPTELARILWLVIHYAQTDGMNDWIRHLPHLMQGAWVLLAEGLKGH